MNSNIKADRARNLRYKRPALASMGWEALWRELYDIQEACTDVHWFTDQGDETLLNALEGSEDDVWEFKIAFADLEAKVDRLIDAADLNWNNAYYGERNQAYDDSTVALIGDKYRIVGFDTDEEDYFSLTRYEEGLAQTEAGKRLMRLTKAEMLSTIGQSFGTLLAFLDLRQQYDYLKATFDILRDENTSMLRQIRAIESAYEAANAAGWWYGDEAVKRFDRLLDDLPDRAWVE